jgi:hypothetical protein
VSRTWYKRLVTKRIVRAKRSKGEEEMTYHNVVKATFAIACAFVLQMTIGFTGDAVLASQKPKSADSVTAVPVPVPAPAPAPAPAKK